MGKKNGEEMKILARILLILKAKISAQSRISMSAKLNFKTQFEGRNSVGRRSVVSGSSIGFASFLGANCYLPSSRIGRYCSIAENVKLIAFTHPSSRFASTHPAFYSILEQAGFTYSKEQKFEERLFLQHDPEFSISIGNDVWIGSDVILMGQIVIGDGAIIAAGSVVVKDVLPYEIVGGVPAKKIRSRFSEAEVTYLNSLAWWNKDRKWLSENAEHFSDIQQMMRKGV